MPTTKMKTCLLLAPRAPIVSHLTLFERMAEALRFDLVRAASGGDRAQAILDASVVLADVSGNDPEVLYWLGVAHTFGKRVFLVTDALERLPYDLASSRAWVVDPASDNREVHAAMARFLQIPYVIGPVRMFLGKFAFFGENLIAQRFLAFLLDAACLLLVLGAIWYAAVRGQGLNAADQALLLIQGSDQVDREARDTTAMVMAGGLYVLLGYFSLSTWLLRATPGQLALSLRVVQTDYRRVTLGQSIGRAVLSVVLVLFTYGGDFLWAMRGPGHRAIHDVLSGTILVRKRTC